MMNKTNNDEHTIWNTLGAAASAWQQAPCIPQLSDMPMTLMPKALISSPKRMEKLTMVSR